MLSRQKRQGLLSLTATLAVTLALVASPAANAQDPDVFTIAGSGGTGYDPADDGGLATDARLNGPAGVVNDAAGNLYFTDPDSHLIRKVDTNGTITTVAGTGQAGYADGPAATAEFNQPFGLDLDSSGNLVVADLSNNVIRYVDLTPGNEQVTTIAGQQNLGPSWVDGLPLQSRFNGPIDVDVDSTGAIFIADRLNHRIRKIEADLSAVSTVAGDGNRAFSGDGGAAASASLNRPQGVFVDASGNIFIADTDNHAVRKVDSATGNINSIAGDGTINGRFNGDGGLATDALLNQPRAVHVDASGNVYIADAYNHRVRMIDVGGAIDTVAGSGPTANGNSGLDEGDFNGEGAPATESRFNLMADVFVDGSGMMIMADQLNVRVREARPATANAAPTDIVPRDPGVDLEADGSILVRVCDPAIDSGCDGPGSRVLRVFAEDPDLTDSHAYSLTTRGKGGENSDLFNIGGSNDDVVRISNPRLGPFGDVSFRVIADDQVDATLEKAFTVTMVDEFPPVIELDGANLVETGVYELDVNLNDPYVAPNVTVIDNAELTLPQEEVDANIQIGGDTVDTSQVGEYAVTYDITDDAGNPAPQVTLTVSVVSADTTPPVITLLGNDPLLLTIGDTYVDPGATAEDDIDGDITDQIVVGGDTVNTSAEGTFTVTYTVSDASGNPAQESRQVIVSAEPPPESDMAVTGDGPASLETGASGTYTVTVTNNGPADTTGVIATIGVPTDVVTVDSASSDQGSCAVSGDGASISCDIGDMASSAAVGVTINVTASDSEGTGSATIEVSSSNTDADTSNNSGTVDISVTADQPPGECEDGIDNDGDGLVDGADPGCSDGTEAPDNSPPPPPSGGGGGGSTGLLLLGLLGMIAGRRRWYSA